MVKEDPNDDINEIQSPYVKKLKVVEIQVEDAENFQIVPKL